MSCQVTVAQGRLQGKQSETYCGNKYYSFEGIPYSKPPIGKLRFRDPQKPESWKGILDATKPGQKCAQISVVGNKGFEGSEDCLYLNIYTPSLPEEKQEKLPVLFYIHGGRFLFGCGDYYRPDYLVKNDVIIVTVNYRLNVLGFLCLNTPEVPGNAGLKDTVMALRWVKENIEKFNGDAANITAFGESAGAAIATTYVTSKIADGLFSKIITESGASVSDMLMDEEDPVNKASRLAAILGKDLTDKESLYEFLLNVPIEDLIYAVYSMEMQNPIYKINCNFLAVVEKEFEGIERYFEECPAATLRKNEFKKVPVLAGYQSHESAYFVNPDEDGNIILVEDLRRFIPVYLSVKFESEEAKRLAGKINEFYFNGKGVNQNMKREYLDFVTDAYFTRDIRLFVELYSKYCSDVYFYRFSYNGNMSSRVMKKWGIKGAAHCDILLYQFYKKTRADKSSEEDRRIVEFLSEAWCNFCKTGKPSWSNQKITWPTYDRKTRKCLDIGEDLQVVSNLDWERFNFWKNLMGESSKL